MTERRSAIESLGVRIREERLDRRSVLKQAMALGLSAPAIAALLAACGGDDDDNADTTPTTAAGQATATTGGGTTPTAGSAPTSASDATATTGSETPAATTAAESTPSAAASSEATADSGATTTRGQGDTLRILYWQGATTLNPHFSQGNNNSAPAKLVLEGLLEVDPDGNFIPVLIDEVPSLENGALAADGKSVTYTLKEGLVWSDGEPFTSDDAIFTWQWVMGENSNVTSLVAFQDIENVTATDERTFTVSFKDTTPVWYRAFSMGVGAGFGGQIVPKHLLQDYQNEKASQAPFNLAPIGTGPYKVIEFKPGDVVTYEINDSYRDPSKPYFKNVEFKGGGDATSAARAVLQTGEVDYSLNLQVEKDVLEQLVQAGAGVLVTALGSNVEQVFINFTDPNTEVDGARSEPSTQHPFFTDLKVRQAFAMACDRQSIADELYGPSGTATANILAGPKNFASTNTTFTYDLDAAAKLLDEAGWVKDGNTRKKDGVEMKILYQTTINPLRQKTQEINKQSWEQLGAPTELKSIDASVFFSTDPGNTDTWAHFYADVEMATNGGGLFPIDYMAFYKSNDPAKDIPQKSNNWSGLNNDRWINEDYNALWLQVSTELDPAKQAEMFIQMNDIAVNDVVAIPLVFRAVVDGASVKLKGNNRSPWSDETYDIADWHFEE